MSNLYSLPPYLTTDASVLLTYPILATHPLNPEIKEEPPAPVPTKAVTTPLDPPPYQPDPPPGLNPGYSFLPVPPYPNPPEFPPPFFPGVYVVPVHSHPAPPLS